MKVNLSEKLRAANGEELYKSEAVQHIAWLASAGVLTAEEATEKLAALPPELERTPQTIGQVLFAAVTEPAALENGQREIPSPEAKIKRARLAERLYGKESVILTPDELKVAQDCAGRWCSCLLYTSDAADE